MSEGINPVVMPKYGLSMIEGKIAAWLVPDGATVSIGEEIAEVETDKIAGVVEAQAAGVLRQVGPAGSVLPVKALIGVITDPSVPAADVDAFVAGYVLPAEEGDGEDAGPKYEYAETAAGSLRYAKRGSGDEAIILVHGFGGDADNWLFNIDALGAAGTVYALDLPGHGQSSKTMASPSLASMAGAVAGFMEAVGVSSAHLVGHSMGGAIAMELAATRPGAVKSLTLIAASGLGPEIGPYVAQYVAATGRKDLKPVLEQLFADKSLVSRKLVDDVLKYKRLDGVEKFLSALAASMYGGGTQQDAPGQKLGSGAPKTLVIWGEKDEIIPAAHAGALPGATTRVLPGIGHMPFMERAGEVNDLILAHVKG